MFPAVEMIMANFTSYMSKDYTVNLENKQRDPFSSNSHEKDKSPNKKEICGMWLNVGIPYMVKSGRSDQLSQWERDWYEENFRPKSR